MSVLSTPVLVLNRDWAAIRFVSARHALSYLVRGAADAIDVEGDSYPNYDFDSWREVSHYKAEFEAERYSFVQCVRSVLAVPPVIRLHTCRRRHMQRPRLTRRAIYARDNNTCQYCGQKFPTSELNLDHVVPRSRGGLTTWANIVCSCVACNSRKGNRTPEQANMRLIRQPTASSVPRDVPRLRHISWQKFLDAAYWNVELKD